MGKVSSTYSGFGERLRLLRARSGLTQQELADKVGFSSNAIAKVERGSNEPSWLLVLALAKALDVPLSEFLYRGPTPVPTSRQLGPPFKSQAIRN